MSGSRPLINDLESEGNVPLTSASLRLYVRHPSASAVRRTKFQTRGHRSISSVAVGVIFLEMCARRRVVILSTQTAFLLYPPSPSLSLSLSLSLSSVRILLPLPDIEVDGRKLDGGASASGCMCGRGLGRPRQCQAGWRVTRAFSSTSDGVRPRPPAQFRGAEGGKERKERWRRGHLNICS